MNKAIGREALEYMDSLLSAEEVTRSNLRVAAARELIKARQKGVIYMATVFDVAKYILEKCGTISTWKLQKLCYYSQAWSLAWTGKALFDEDFEAWRNGPVCRELFYKHKGMYDVDASLLPDASSDNLTDDEKDTINVVLDSYGDKEPYELRSQTHNEKPWRDMRAGLGDFDMCTKVITKTAMGDYYGSL